MRTGHYSFPRGPSAVPIRWLTLLGLVALGFALGYSFLGPLAPDADSFEPVPFSNKPVETFAKPDDLVLPTSTLSPREVVELQMKALAGYRDDRRVMHQVFAFASPANQSVTGPIERFEEMILGEQYRPLVDCDHWMAGKAIERDNMATVLVTTVDDDESVNLFRFYLSQQSENCPNCWRTDRVSRLFGDSADPSSDRVRSESTAGESETPKSI